MGRYDRYMKFKIYILLKIINTHMPSLLGIPKRMSIIVIVWGSEKDMGIPEQDKAV